MADIFISYSRKDRDKLDELVPLFRTVYGNNSVWFDNDIQGGDNWWSRILQEIYKCKLFIFLVSDTSLDSEYCQKEIQEALRLSRRVLPIVLNTATSGNVVTALKNIDDQLPKIHYITLTDGLNNALDMAKLWGAVNSTGFGVSSSLSRMERWYLINQYLVLDKLYPDHEYSKAIRVLEGGYELHYDTYTQFVDEGMSTEKCREVVDILAMFDFIERFVKANENDPDIDINAIKSIGFDGNNEGEYWGYLQFLVEVEEKFHWLDYANEFNTHFPMVETYRRMLGEWNNSVKPYELTKDDVIRIISARYNR